MTISASSWTPRFPLSPSPSWSMLPSLVTASAKSLSLIRYRQNKLISSPNIVFYFLYKRDPSEVPVRNAAQHLILDRFRSALGTINEGTVHRNRFRDLKAIQFFGFSEHGHNKSKVFRIDGRVQAKVLLTFFLVGSRKTI